MGDQTLQASSHKIPRSYLCIPVVAGKQSIDARRDARKDLNMFVSIIGPPRRSRRVPNDFVLTLCGTDILGALQGCTLLVGLQEGG